MKCVIYWFRRDLRLMDHPGLAAAAESAECVVPVYVISDWKENHRWTGPHRQTFLCACLQELADGLQDIGNQLIFRQGDAVEELAKLVTETKAEAIYFVRSLEPHGRKMEEKLARLIKTHGVELKPIKDTCLHEQDEVQTQTGTPFRVFTPYSKAWGKLDKPEPRGKLRKLTGRPGLRTLLCPTPETWGLTASKGIVAGGEKAARRRMIEFLKDGVEGYGRSRDSLDEQATSRLSQDLRFGLISLRELFHMAQERAKTGSGRSDVDKFVREVIWREFCFNIIWHYPEVLETEFNEKYRGMKWKGTKEDFRRWCHGETGFPIVDAAMRELNETGYMHNRARLITAMFLTKDLHVDWREGERYFLQQLTEGDIPSNNGNWQWCAGTGADAAPYFRILNPWTQAAKFDRDAKYIRRWLPELRDVSTERLLRPSDTPLVKGYPLPMVDHAEEREETLRMFSVHRAD